MRLSERGFTWFYWVRPDLCGDRFPSWPQSSPPPVGPMLSMFATEHARSHMGEEGRPGRQLPTRSERRNKCHATSNRCLTSSNNKLLGTSASLLVTRARSSNLGAGRSGPINLPTETCRTDADVAPTWRHAAVGNAGVSEVCLEEGLGWTGGVWSLGLAGFLGWLHPDSSSG